MADAHQQLQRLIQQGDVLEGRYRIGRRIGAGAYGLIFSAVDEVTSERVAIKAIPPGVNQVSDTAMARFKRELKVVRNLVHGNIITLYDWGRTEEGLIFMVLEYIDGDTLDVVVRDHPLPPKEAIRILLQLAQALQTAHSQGVIHRDLKPANVMLSEDRNRGYRAKILDFGMAKVLEPLDDESLVDLTREGMAVGTPRYIAPEQARGLKVGPTADIYALGLLFYEMLTGQQAVKASTVEEAVIAHVSPEPLPLDEIDQVPQGLRSLLENLLAKKPEERIPTAAALIEVLRGYAKGTDILVPPRSHHGAIARTALPDGLAGDEEVLASFDPDEYRPENKSSKKKGKKGGKKKSKSSLGGLFSRNSDDIDLDYDRYREFAPRRFDPIARRREYNLDRYFRIPRRFSEWLETGLSFGLFGLSFLVVTAQLATWDFGLRLAMGLIAPGLALGLATYKHSPIWGESFGRYCWIFCLLALVGVHFFGLQGIMNELSRNPVWFLFPLQDIPGMGLLASLMTQVAGFWVSLLEVLSGLLELSSQG